MSSVAASPSSRLGKRVGSKALGAQTKFHKARTVAVYCLFSRSTADQSSGLHACGVADSGKSVLTAKTIRWLQKSGCVDCGNIDYCSTTTPAGYVVLFFFFCQIVDKNHTGKHLVRNLGAQLLPNCPALVTSLMALLQNHAIDDCEMDLVWAAIIKALIEEDMGEQVFCMVDAWDEMDNYDFDDMT
ncbi:hypothetical protein FSARC_14893 [Fusarium sarcochroum]|uniref:Nephrocystin 3-like N-terminal domain-containing protein n=1 Tax=Fusarium sarcochroum TaxID=1208366 RepID=A0A8H4SQ83_9HYPO|nr:hypothetical protein FSARC_14893 [Fusarium sarcochroum]